MQATFFKLMRDAPEEFMSSLERRISKAAAELSTHKLKSQQQLLSRTVAKRSGRLFASPAGGGEANRATMPKAAAKSAAARDIGATAAALATRHAGAPATSSQKDEVALQNARAERQAIESISSLFRFLQVLCEGHCFDIQNFLREQRESSRPVNIVAACAQFLEKLVAVVDANSVNLMLQVYDTLTEFIQGPCESNQLCLVNQKFVEVTCVVLDLSLASPPAWAKHAKSNGVCRLLQLKATVALVSLFEGRSDNVVHARVVSQVCVCVYMCMCVYVGVCVCACSARGVPCWFATSIADLGYLTLVFSHFDARVWRVLTGRACL